MFRSLIAPLAVASLALLPGAAAGASAHSPIQVSPASGAAGTRFSISFVVPRTAAKGAYQVTARADRPSASTGCAASFTFTNPKRVLAHVKISFAFTPRRVHELCAGRWTVTVRSTDSGQIVLAGGHFGLHPPLAPG